MSVPPDQMGAPPAAAATSPSTPPAADTSDDGGFGYILDTYNRDKSMADDQRARLDRTISGFSPPTNPTPAFTDQPPTDHFNSIVGLAPMLMALGAIGGKFGNVHGIAMIQSTNAMMKGMVQGSADQYSDARTQFEQKYSEWKEQNRTWNDVYKQYMEAYKGSVDAQQRAVTAANQAVGIDQKELDFTEKKATDRQKISIQIEKQADEALRHAHQNVTDQINAEAHKETADAAAKRADLAGQKIEADKTKKSDKAQKATAAGLEAISQIDDLEKLVKDNKYITGFGGKGRGIVEWAESSVDPGMDPKDLPQTQFKSLLEGLQMKIPAYLDLHGGSSGKYKMEEIQSAFGDSRGATSGPQMVTKLENLKRMILDNEGVKLGPDGKYYQLIEQNGTTVAKRLN